MFLLIDNVKLTIAKRTKTLRQAEYWAELLCKGDYRIQDVMVRGWSAYTQDELKAIYKNTRGRGMPDKNDNNRVLLYSDSVHLVAELARSIEVDETTERDLAKRLGREPPTPSEALPAHTAAGGARFAGQGARATSERAPRTPRPERVAGAAPTRPREGTTTGRVWAIADGVAGASPGEGKALRVAIIAACVAEGIDPSTAATQYSKWNRALKGA